MEIYTVCFFGHRRLSPRSFREAEGLLTELIHRLLDEKDYVEFLVGRDGDFDQLVASTVRRVRRDFRSDNSALTWIMPYRKAEYTLNEKAFQAYYDAIEICCESEQAHFKNAYRLRNQNMVDRSDLTVAWVEQESGGAWQALRYARRSRRPNINLFDEASKP